jgi:hypothetical protein
MITFTRDEAQKLLDTLVEATDAQQWELDTHIKTHGEWFRPARVEYMRDVLNSTLRMIEMLNHKLNSEPWVKTYSGGKPNYTQPEPTVDGWPLYSGLPEPKWVGLSDAEIGEIYRAGWSNNMDFARALEAKLKEKNT